MIPFFGWTRDKIYKVEEFNYFGSYLTDDDEDDLNPEIDVEKAEVSAQKQLSGK